MRLCLDEGFKSPQVVESDLKLSKNDTYCDSSCRVRLKHGRIERLAGG